MKTYRIAILAAAVMLAAIPARTQTAGELLQKGIYTQDTAGDLDAAIAIYRQIIGSGNSPRDIAAPAQYRLAQSMIEKGDLANGANEFSNLARNYADYGKLIASLAAQANKKVNLLSEGGRGGRGAPERGIVIDRAESERLLAEIQSLKASVANSQEGRASAALPAAELQARLQAAMTEMARRETEIRDTQQRMAAAMTFDTNSPITVKGAVIKLQFQKPNSFMSVDPGDGTGKRYTFILSGAALGRNTARIQDQVTVVGAPATGGQTMPDGSIAVLATTITNANGVTIYDRGEARQ